MSIRKQPKGAMESEVEASSLVTTSDQRKKIPQLSTTRGHIQPLAMERENTAIIFNMEVEKHVKQTNGKRYDLDATSKKDDSDFYDTDLESDDDTENQKPSYDQNLYQRICQKLRISPITNVIDGLRAKKICIRNRGLNDKSILALSMTLLENDTVHTLELESNDIQEKGSSYLALLIEVNHNITVLNLSENQLSGVPIKRLSGALIKNKSVASLILSGTQLGDRDAPAIAKLIEETSVIQTLDLSHNSLGDEAASLLGKAIASNESIQELNLHWNNIRPKGGIALCKGIQENITLKTLDLSMNGLSSQGTMALAASLKKNMTLRHLNISSNRVYDTGLMALAHVLMTNETLQSLKIGHNPWTYDGVSALLNAVKKNEQCQLALLDLGDAHISKELMGQLSEIQARNGNFSMLYMGLLTSSSLLGKASSNALTDKNPLTLLKEYIAENNLRLLDIFKQLDADGSMTVSRDEFVEGLKSLKVPLSNGQLDQLMDMLDKDKDGEVDFGELVEGDKNYRREQRKKKISVRR